VGRKIRLGQKVAIVGNLKILIQLVENIFIASKNGQQPDRTLNKN